MTNMNAHMLSQLKWYERPVDVERALGLAESLVRQHPDGSDDVTLTGSEAVMAVTGLVVMLKDHAARKSPGWKYDGEYECGVHHGA